MARTAAKTTDERRTEILAVAESRLLSGGYKKMSMEALSVACHVSPAHLYNFFPAKIDIAVALAERECTDLIAKVRERAKTGKPEARLRRFLLAELDLTFAFLERNPVYFEVLERIGRQRPREANLLLAAGRHHLSDILQAGCEEGYFAVKDVNRTAEVIQIAMLKFRFPQLITQLPLADLRCEADDLIDCLVKGIARR